MCFRSLKDPNNYDLSNPDPPARTSSGNARPQSTGASSLPPAYSSVVNPNDPIPVDKNRKYTVAEARQISEARRLALLESRGGVPVGPGLGNTGFGMHTHGGGVC